MPMKVVVCFNSVRVTVPCGEGDIPVKELINKAVHRYKRAVGKGTDHQVEVTSLKTISGGGILDPDDQLNDVVDDREQLIAEYEEQNRPPVASLSSHQHHHHQHNGGDGASASSTGTTSPDPFSHHHNHQHSTYPHHQLHVPLPGDSFSSSSSSAATVPPPLPSVPPPVAPTFGAPPPLSSKSRPSEISLPLPSVDTGGRARCDSSSSNSNNVASDVIVVTPRDLTLGTTLRVRRGSEPNLTSLMDSALIVDRPMITAGNLKPLITRRESIRDSDEPRSESSDDEKQVRMTMTNSLDRKKIGMSRFTRDSWRSSLSNRPEMYRWLEAQQKAEKQAADKDMEAQTWQTEDQDMEGTQQNMFLVCLKNDGGPLGIHAIPAHNESGTAIGLLVQSTEEGRPVHRDGRIQAKDTIVEINGTSLYDIPFLKAQEVFRAAMDTHEIRLKVIKGETQQDLVPEVPARRKTAPKPPPVMPKPRNHAPLKPSPLAASPPQRPSPVPAPRDPAKSALIPSIPPTTQGVDSVLGSFTPVISASDDCKQPTSSLSSTSVPRGKTPDLLPSPTVPPKKPVASVIKPGPPIKAPKKAVPALPIRNPNRPSSATPVSPSSPISPTPALSPLSPTPALSSFNPTPSAEAPINAVFNTRRIGKKIVIQLRKGPQGLGFSVTSRDNQTGGDCPIYIRNILPRGAAVQDGQLRPGDRLLEVNGVEMTGKTQPEAVSFLRTIPEGSLAELVVSRQEEVDEKFKIPRKMGEIQTQTESREPSSQRTKLPASDYGYEDDGDEESSHTLLLQHPSQSLDSIDGGPAAKEKLTFCIPLNETGSAGLGVSVKGKTQSSDAGMRDLGIFVKTVLQGGAAYKDGRLQVNDQLLDVNGIRLEGQPNTAAMEALRTAMLEESDNSGFITLSVLRRAPGTPLSPPLPPQDKLKQFGAHSFQPPQPHSGRSAQVIHQRSSSASDTVNSRVHKFGPENTDMPSPIPPARSKRVAALRERFSSDTGNNGLRNDSYHRATNESLSLSPSQSSSGLRNESYAKATHDSINEPETFTQGMPLQPKWNQPNGRLEDSKENIPTTDQDPSKQQRPHSTIGFLHGSRPSHNSASDDDAFIRTSVASSKEESDLSPSLELIAPFAREGFGRQSMSEKRKGHLDPRNTETYKMVKANKETKGGLLGRRVHSFHVSGNVTRDASGASGVNSSQNPSKQEDGTEAKQPLATSVESPPSAPPPKPNELHEKALSYQQPNRSEHQTTPAGMKKSSSVEDLINPSIPNIVSNSSSGTNQNRDMSPAWRQNRFGRARACNDSFRAAVDRSYDALDPALMDTLEEESAESGAFTLDPSNSGRSSISSDNPEDTNSLKRKKAKEKEKKGGLLKGFLRFGKGRKSNEEAMRRSRSEERPGEKVLTQRVQDLNSDVFTGEDMWEAGQPFGDAKALGFVPVADIEQHSHQPQQQRGRRFSKTDQERVDEEYARLRDYHTSEQRLRSQSVDPSAHRRALSPWERSSPFQPYISSQGSQHPGQGHKQSYLTDQVQGYSMDKQDNSEADLRRYHPAAVGYRKDSTDPGSKHYFTDAGLESGGRPLAKAVLSRAEYIQQLRSLYQQQHKQRQGVYPLDDAEEKYERQLQEMERKGIPVNSDYLNDASSSQNLLKFTDRPPSRQLEQRRSERTYSSSNANTNSMHFGGRNYHPHQHYEFYNSSTTLPHSRPHSRGGSTSTYDSSNNSNYYHHQKTQLFGNYQHQQHYQPPNHHYSHQHEHLHQQPRGYDHPPQQVKLNYRDYPPGTQDHSSSHYRHPSYESYSHDHFYRGPPQAYRSAPSQYPPHRSTTPYSDPAPAKV